MAPLIHQSDACHHFLFNVFLKNNSATLTNFVIVTKTIIFRSNGSLSKISSKTFVTDFFSSKVLGYWSCLETLLLRLRHVFLRKKFCKVFRAAIS